MLGPSAPGPLGARAAEATMTTPRIREVAALCLLLGLALLACKKNAANTKACQVVGKTSSEACQSCCKAHGSTGYRFVNGDCSCLGG